MCPAFHTSLPNNALAHTSALTLTALIWTCALGRVRVLCPGVKPSSIKNEAQAMAALARHGTDEVGFLQFFHLHRSSPVVDAVVRSKRLAGVAAQLLGVNRVRLYQVMTTAQTQQAMFAYNTLCFDAAASTDVQTLMHAVLTIVAGQHVFQQQGTRQNQLGNGVLLICLTCCNWCLSGLCIPKTAWICGHQLAQ